DKSPVVSSIEEHFKLYKISQEKVVIIDVSSSKVKENVYHSDRVVSDIAIALDGSEFLSVDYFGGVCLNDSDNVVGADGFEGVAFPRRTAWLDSSCFVVAGRQLEVWKRNFNRCISMGKVESVSGPIVGLASTSPLTEVLSLSLSGIMRIFRNVSGGD